MAISQHRTCFIYISSEGRVGCEFIHQTQPTDAPSSRRSSQSHFILLIYYKIPTVLHYRGYQKKSGCKHFITRLHIEKTNRKCLPLTKYTENTGPEMIFFGFKKKMKSTKIRAAIPSNKTSIWCGLSKF